jgi:predicted RNA binding protein YcfA (HicA-like mRNA interferase family)
MGHFEKLFEKIIKGESDANIDFDDLCKLLQKMGFTMRINGSHHIFRMSGIEDKINLQRDGNKAKAYQIRQIRKTLMYYNLKELQ